MSQYMGRNAKVGCIIFFNTQIKHYAWNDDWKIAFSEKKKKIQKQLKEIISV